MEIISSIVSELDNSTRQYLHILGYKDEDNVDIAYWYNDDNQLVTTIVPKKK